MGCTSSSKKANGGNREQEDDPESSRTSRDISQTGSGSSKASSRTGPKKLEVVAAGHAAKGGVSIQAEDGEDGKPGVILKMFDEQEYDVYSRMSEYYKSDPVHEFIPTFEGAQDSTDEEGNKQRFIRMRNLLHGFHSPKVIDVKIGVRTFLESECQNKKLRPDLFERMLEMYPTELSEDDRSNKGITKHKWMTVRDKVTTIGTLGYRIDGIAGYRRIEREMLDKRLADVCTRETASVVFKEFAEIAAADDGAVDQGHTSLFVAERIRQRLYEMYCALEASDFVKRCEFIGSSVLIVADAYGHFGVSWIDFAKTHFLDPGMELTHTDKWEMGNHEDGIIFGLEQLLDAWDHCVMRLREGDMLRGISSTKVSIDGWRPNIPSPPTSTMPRDESMNDEMAILSSLPVFSSRIVDPKGRVWSEGSVTGKNAMTVVAKLGDKLAGAAKLAKNVISDRRGSLEGESKTSTPATSRTFDGDLSSPRLVPLGESSEEADTKGSGTGNREAEADSHKPPVSV